MPEQAIWHPSGMGLLKPARDREYICFETEPELVSLCVVQFWELDTDHDFYICKEDLLRYGNHSLTYRIVDRIFSQVSWPHAVPCHVLSGPSSWCKKGYDPGAQGCPDVPACCS